MAVSILSKLDLLCLTLMSTQLSIHSFCHWLNCVLLAFFKGSVLRKCIFTNMLSTFRLFFCERGSPVRSASSRTHVMESMYLCSSRSTARGEVEGPKGALCQLKKPLRVWNWDKWVTGRIYREQRYVTRSHYIALKTMICYKKRK